MPTPAFRRNRNSALEGLSQTTSGAGGPDYAADFRNSLPLYWLRKALNESTGRFQYGHNYAAQTGYSGWGTVLSDKDIENINSHPENYAVIMCLYH